VESAYYFASEIRPCLYYSIYEVLQRKQKGQATKAFSHKDVLQFGAQLNGRKRRCQPLCFQSFIKRGLNTAKSVAGNPSALS
jgi:excinuclease UvrABC nuclease subunit